MDNFNVQKPLNRLCRLFSSWLQLVSSQDMELSPPAAADTSAAAAAAAAATTDLALFFWSILTQFLDFFLWLLFLRLTL